MYGKTRNDKAEVELLTAENINSKEAPKGNRGKKGWCILKCLGRMGN